MSWLLFSLLLIQDARAPAAQPRTEAALYDWYRCLFGSVRSTADEPDAPERIAQGAFGQCADKEGNLRTAVRMESARRDREATQRQVETYKAQAAPKVLAFVLDVRRIRARTSREGN